MDNINFIYTAILYVSGCPVGFIDNLGFIVSEFDRSCRFFLSPENLLTIPYSPKSSNRESVRLYKVPYSIINRAFSFTYAVENLERVEKRIEFLSDSVVIQKRKNAARAVGNRESYMSLVNDS